MEVAIVDDRDEELITLKEYLTRFADESGDIFNIDTYPSGDGFLTSFNKQYDLILMDIDMPGLSGIDTARAIRDRDENVVLMFVTNMPGYALAGYEVDAIDYIIKPVLYPDFALKLKKALRYVNMNKVDASIMLRTNDGMISLNIKDIYYVESSLHYCIYHTDNAEYRVRESMSSVEQKLKPYQFAKCNSGYLVALKHVRAILKDDVMVGDFRLKISRSKKSDFTAEVTRVLGGL